jgi:hypothetical protein
MAVNKVLLHFNNIRAATPNELSSGFQWRDRKGNFHFPHLMETRHLFYTVRMIWNHTMPYKIHPYIRYSFGKFYTKAYMVMTVKVMVRELSRRHDIAPQWQADIDIMIEWLARSQIAHKKNNKIKHHE